MHYMGRLKLGDELSVQFRCVDQDDRPASLIRTPRVSVYVGGSRVASDRLVRSDRDVDGLFVARMQLGQGWSAGKLILHVRYEAATATGTYNGRIVAHAEIVGGGDPAGETISLYSFARPDGRYIVAQMSQGRIYRGRNPRFSQ